MLTTYGSSTELKKPKPQNIEALLKGHAKRFRKTNALRKGSIVLRLTGVGGGDFCLDFSTKNPRLYKGITQSNPTIEVIADVSKVKAILEGKTNARKEFLAGGMRIRGDLDRALELALELGMIKRRV